MRHNATNAKTSQSLSHLRGDASAADGLSADGLFVDGLASSSDNGLAAGLSDDADVTVRDKSFSPRQASRFKRHYT